MNEVPDVSVRFLASSGWVEGQVLIRTGSALPSSHFIFWKTCVSEGTISRYSSGIFSSRYRSRCVCEDKLCDAALREGNDAIHFCPF
ncbi:MAG: hypothetical protein ACYCXP_05225 [Leptospirillum sp.]